MGALQKNAGIIRINDLQELQRVFCDAINRDPKHAKVAENALVFIRRCKNIPAAHTDRIEAEVCR